MKWRTTVGLLAVLGCTAEAPELTEEQQTEVRDVGVQAASALMRGLGSRLGQALQEGGPTHAVSFCSGEALSLTDSVASDLGNHIELKRTSLKYRNPSNAPDQLEIEALRHFSSSLQESGQIPSHYIQQVSADEIRYYQPLMIAELCLQCHGTDEHVSAEVKEMIAEKYPSDQATGYETGDLRGVIRVSIAPESLEQ
jgi:hypothetical protein